MIQKAIMISALLGASILLDGCASISEDACLAGSWSDIGYKDGAKGKSRGKLADYAETCGKYGVTPDRTAYLTAYESGLDSYCTFDQGFSLGENGSEFNQVCSTRTVSGFAEGYDDGRALYEIRKEHRNLKSEIENRVESLTEVKRRLSDEEMDDDERDRLNKKRRRLRKQIEDLRIDIRAHERLYDLPRFQMPENYSR